MNILYLHGLDGSLSEEKRTALSKYGVVFGPQIDYRSSENIFDSLVAQFQDKKIDVVIGNSAGGLAGYYISLAYNTPCLIFNPALPYSSIIQNIPQNLPKREKYLQVVLGKKDDVIKANDNLVFLEKNLDADFEYSTHLLNNVGHQIPIANFETELASFFDVVGRE
ncbi:alpha/beta hydrolase [Pedobacter changchengzhani]|uniref:Alpha/beta hydrolase n=1 Tax=Pedobacter changchengzhani TaxID=2529274 RepID=A0A4R5MNH3_9SPHI|nr:YqiA/YcfP family alpha/beta fold hydrolase [Pedobacter changchengzhani]TDG37116.1 alpha/beta hydrolase [Pedobacter changchengzhani]